TGFIGRPLVRKLVAAGHQVTALVRDPATAAATTSPSVTLAEGDVTDRASVSRAVAGAEGVFHLAGLYALGRAHHARMAAINVGGTRNVIEAAVEAGVRRIVHTSTVGVFGNTHGRLVDESYRVEKGALGSEYERTKWAAHYEVALPAIARGAPVIIVQPGGVTGPGDASPLAQLYDMFLKRMPVMLGATSGITVAHVDDIVDGHIGAMQRGRVGESYILAGPALTYRQIMEIFQEITGIAGPSIWLPGGAAAAMSKVASVIESFTSAGLTFNSESLATLNDYTFWATSAKAERALDWHARPAEATFADALAFELSRRGLKATTRTLKPETGNR
ncbi:MAG TPA: NAD-dependent epimerase/dehydratase family protein, partial [Dongiaceae bacterium]|nr:NAD-dependent epimerase/dehydratase family protein [Dongiaceae bacterium]